MSHLSNVFYALLKALGEDPNRGGLQETPERAAKAWEFWTSGYTQDPAKVMKTFEDGAEGYQDLIFQGNIPLYSHCEHHLAPFFGVAHIGYIPDGKVLGLSKLKTQERLTKQVADALYEGLVPKGVAVNITCRHLCMESRGIQTAGTETTTSALRGIFSDDAAAHAEFLGFVAQANERRPR
jgi:GTP cyclohydrolase I